jgi:hypothetical protein
MLLQHSRQKVLPRMLLHVVESALPIDAEVYAGTDLKATVRGRRNIDEVPNAAINFLDIDHGELVNGA